MKTLDIIKTANGNLFRNKIRSFLTILAIFVGSFTIILNTAINNINTTNAYLSNAENEKIKFALGESESTHDLSIALQKATTALQYTVSVRDKFLEAYKEIMNMQI